MTLLSGFVCHLSGSINGLWSLSLRSFLNLWLWSLSLWSLGLRGFLNLNLRSLSLRSFLNLNLRSLGLRSFLNFSLWNLSLRGCYSWSLNRSYNFSFFSKSESITVTCLPKMEICSETISERLPSRPSISHFSILPLSPM